MTLTRKDVMALLPPGLALVIGLATAGGLVAYSVAQARDGEREFAQARQIRLQAEARTRQVNAEAFELKEKGEAYQALLQQRVIGPENRLDWIESLRQMERQNNLFHLDYDLSPRQKLTAATSGALNASVMTLSAPLLHEGDLLALVDNLRSTRGALVIPTECTLARPVNSPRRAASGPQPSLDGECRLVWVTVDAEGS